IDDQRCLHHICLFLSSFFFQAEDGIRDFHVTGVQTCALPISIACYAVLEGEQLWLRGFVGQPDASILLRAEQRAHKKDAEALGIDRKSVVQGKSVECGGCGWMSKTTSATTIAIGRKTIEHVSR